MNILFVKKIQLKHSPWLGCDDMTNPVTDAAFLMFNRYAYSMFLLNVSKLPYHYMIYTSCYWHKHMLGDS
jgi:hypothetical protein